MKRLLFIVVCAALVGVGLLYNYGKLEGSKQSIRDQVGAGGGIESGISAKPASQEQVNKTEVNRKIAKLHVPFIANEGQTDEGVKFYAPTFGGTIFVTNKGEIVYSLPKFEEEVAKGEANVLKPNPEPRTPNPAAILALKEELVGGKVEAVKGEGESVTKVSYFRGNDQSKWKSGIATYEVVSLGEVYEGVELKLKAYGNNVEKLFYVKSGAEPEKIKMRLNGSKGLNVNKNGELEVETELGAVKFTKPVAFQEAEGKKEFVEVAYAVEGDEYGFKVGEYDRERQLVIDPLLASTFLGGSSGFRGSSEFASFIVLDSSGNVYLSGSTASSNFPTTPGAFDTSPSFEGDAFISKLSRDLTSLLASTFLGGDREDSGSFLVLDPNGNVYVTGSTRSSNFPTTPGAFDRVLNASLDNAFVSKLSGDLTDLLASTFLGGSIADSGSCIALDSNGNVYVTGLTSSSDFPVTPNAFDTSSDGVFDVFVSKLSGGLTSLLASTFLGGIGGDSGSSLVLDSSGNVYVASETGSSDFPIIPGVFDTSFNGGLDVSVSKLSADLTSLLASTFLGGGSTDARPSVVLDSSGDIYVTGLTFSSDFPTTPGAFDTSSNDPFDIFVSKLNGDLTDLVASTFLGGGGSGSGPSLALDSNGDVYVAGGTDSSEFPTTPGAFDTSLNDGSDAFILKLSGDLTDLVASTFLGGSSRDFSSALALDSRGDVYVAGVTPSSDFPTTLSAFDTSFNIGFSMSVDIFVSKFDPNLSGVICGGFVPTIVGSEGNDIITGTGGRDVIHGLRGNDTINGLDSKDIICGGSGNDIIDGGIADDRIFGGDGRDTVDGGGGNDTIFGNSGNDTLRGNEGDDRMDGLDGVDVCDGGGQVNKDTAINCETVIGVP